MLPLLDMKPLNPSLLFAHVASVAFSNITRWVVGVKKKLLLFFKRLNVAPREFVADGGVVVGHNIQPAILNVRDDAQRAHPSVCGSAYNPY